MAKKTTKTDVPLTGAEKDASPAKPARRAVAKLAGSVKKKIKSVLEPKPKKSNGTSPVASAAVAPQTEGASATKRKTRETGATPAARKTARSSNGSKRTAAQGEGSGVALQFTSDDVALRAYFLAQHRMENGNPGSPEEDWIEAERQLAAESTQSLVHS